MPWWDDAVVYQIYPRSFQDSDGNGVGDLAGVERRLDHLTWLGADALWLSPIYPSPLADMGYDVAEYDDVDPVYGDLDVSVIDERPPGRHPVRTALRYESARGKVLVVQIAGTLVGGLHFAQSSLCAQW